MVFRAFEMMCSIRMFLLVLSDLCFVNEEFSDFALYHWEIVLFSLTYLLLFINEDFSDFALYHWELGNRIIFIEIFVTF